MINKYMDRIHRINCAFSDTSSLYHQAAQKFGLSDSAMFVLYMLHYKGGSCLLNDVCKELGIRKQTLNSTIRNLEADGVVYLEQGKGKTKVLCLTEEGKSVAKRTGGRLLEIECKILSQWSDELIDHYIDISEKYNALFSKELKK